MNHTLVCVDVYTISAGDTLYSIAEKYDLPVPLLMKVNCITNPYNLQIGAKLCIPGDPSQLPQPPAEDVPSEPQQTIHVVEAGDTLYLIAKKHGVKLDDIMNANPSIDPYNLMIGTELIVPL
ncbi:LysM peptidoglycan-binding domain-containing protein [Ihubacter sp. rT4E-8]|uniref:LysM peptidoglycan-binding domain-containing protein n=1 Tax=unclassified Ihubacter TaxID=2633299 RepID=UPI00137ADA12